MFNIRFKQTRTHNHEAELIMYGGEGGVVCNPSVYMFTEISYISRFSPTPANLVLSGSRRQPTMLVKPPKKNYKPWPANTRQPPAFH